MPYTTKLYELSLLKFSRRIWRGIFFAGCKKFWVNRLLNAAERRLLRVNNWKLKSHHIKQEITFTAVNTTEPQTQLSWEASVSSSSTHLGPVLDNCMEDVL